MFLCHFVGFLYEFSKMFKSQYLMVSMNCSFVRHNLDL